MEYNKCLERLELKLYELLDRLLDEHRYGEACQVVEIMQKVGIV